MSTARENVTAFHTWHSSRTYNAGNPQIDPWLRDVLVSLQSTLNLLADQLDDNTSRIGALEFRLNTMKR